jgi:hypothetical protein|tara:strand:- start:1502 stop:2275 length:774 start_codon:yes stop_codon:yes gene_type:complete
MATTYLDLTNEVLRELNEVVLTSSTFSSATGIQSFVKDALNKSIFDISNEEPQLPFLSAGVSGGTDPFYGNVTVASVAGTRWYTLKASSSSITTDYASVDWDDFYLTTINVSGETAPYVSKGLRFLTLSDWKRFYRDGENSDDAEGSDASHGEPLYVIKSPDHRKFGLSPIPDKVYNVHFYAFTKPTALSSHDDTIVLPEQYSNVVTSRTRYYVHQFKENIQQAAFALDEYKKNMKTMKSNLINPVPTYMSDDRTYF